MNFTNGKNRVLGRWPFLVSFVFACFLFWWLPSILYRFFVHESDGVHGESIAISVIALLLFIAGYLFPTTRHSTRLRSDLVLDSCGDFAYRTTILFAIPAFVVSAMFWHSHAEMTYGSTVTDSIPFSYQAILYTHLFIGFLFLGSADPESQGWCRVQIASTLVILPRFIISLHWGRFFLAQAIVPAILIAIARGWVKFSFNRLLQIGVLALAILLALQLPGEISTRAKMKSFTGSPPAVRCSCSRTTCS